MPISTFPITLINLNLNINNLYLYDIISYNLKTINCTIHKMKPSHRYLKLMKGNWKNSKEQLDLMLNENCINSKMLSFASHN